MTKTIMRVDQVTLRYFDTIGVSITDWATRLQKRPSFGTKTLIMGLLIKNPCREIPINMHTGVELESYTYTEPDRIHPDVASGRMTGGTIYLEEGSSYHTPTLGGDQRARISMPKIADTIAEGLIGQSARRIYDSDIFDNVTVSAVIQNKDSTDFMVWVPWEMIEVEIPGRSGK